MESSAQCRLHLSVIRAAASSIQCRLRSHATSGSGSDLRCNLHAAQAFREYFIGNLQQCRHSLLRFEGI